MRVSPVCRYCRWFSESGHANDYGICDNPESPEYERRRHGLDTCRMFTALVVLAK